MLLLGQMLLAACSGGSGSSGPAGTGGAGGGSNAGTAGSSGPVGGNPGNGGNAGSSGHAGSNGNAGSSGAAGIIGGAGSNGAGGSTAGGAGGASAGGGGGGTVTGSGGAMGNDSGADTGGAKNCAGNAISLGANGTGTDSDAARARVVIDLMTDLPIGDANRTVEFWAYIRPTDWVGERNELYVYGDLGVKAGAFGMDFGTFTVAGMAGNHATLNPITGGGFNDDSTNDLGLTSTTTQWVHIAMTWDGTVVRTYVNGSLRITSKGTGGVTALATVAAPLTIGCNPPIFNCFNGLYDELRVWKTARSDAEIMANYDKTMVGDEAGLVGYWKFDEAQGAVTAADSVTGAGHGAHAGALMSATSAGHPTFVTPTPPAPILCP